MRLLNLKNKQNEFANVFLLFFLPKELLIFWMLGNNANTVLRVLETCDRLFVFKSPLSCRVLLYVAAQKGCCGLKDVFKTNFATDIALRQHIQILEERGFVTTRITKESKRSKEIELTAKGYDLLRQFEMEIQPMMLDWERVRANKRT